MTDPRTRDTLELAGFIREHTEDRVLPFVNELERRYFQMWAQMTLLRADYAHKAAEANELYRDDA